MRIVRRRGRHTCAVLSIRPLKGGTLASCLASMHGVSVRVTEMCYRRVCCQATGKRACFTTDFGGSTNKCRLHGDCSGHSLLAGKVAAVSGNGGSIILFRNFASLLSFVALGGGTNGPCLGAGFYVLGAATGLRGTCPFLKQRGKVADCLSASDDNLGSCGDLQDRFRGARAMGGKVRRLRERSGEVGSIGSCLVFASSGRRARGVRSKEGLSGE